MLRSEPGDSSADLSSRLDNGFAKGAGTTGVSAALGGSALIGGGDWSRTSDLALMRRPL